MAANVNAQNRAARFRQWVSSLWTKSSDNSEGNNGKFQVPQNIFEGYAAKVKLRFPTASDKQIRAKALALFMKARRREIERRVNQMTFNHDDSDDGVNFDDPANFTPKMVAPLNIYNNKSNKEIKGLLTTIESPQKLSHLLLNPVTNVRGTRLISEFTAQMMLSSPAHRATTKNNVFHIAMAHTEAAIVHQLVVDRVHKNWVRKGNKWGFRSILQTNLRFTSTRAHHEARDYITEFTTCFDTLKQLSQLVMPSRNSIISFQEALEMLVMLSNDDSSFETWPPALASGSDMFGNLYTDMYDASFTSEEAQQRHDQINDTRNTRSREATSRKNRSLLDSLHSAKDPQSEGEPLTRVEQDLVDSLTVTIHPGPQRPAPRLQQIINQANHSSPPFATSTQLPRATPFASRLPATPQQMPSVIFPASTPVSSRGRGPRYNPDALCNLENIVWPDHRSVSLEKIYEVLNYYGAGLTLRPRHHGLTVDLSYLPNFASARLEDVHAICTQAMSDFDTVSSGIPTLRLNTPPPPYVPGYAPGSGANNSPYGAMASSQMPTAPYGQSPAIQQRQHKYPVSPELFQDSESWGDSGFTTHSQTASGLSQTCTIMTPHTPSPVCSPLCGAGCHLTPVSARGAAARSASRPNAAVSAEPIRAKQLLQQIQDLKEQIEFEEATPHSNLELSNQLIKNWAQEAEEKMEEYSKLMGWEVEDLEVTEELEESARRDREARLNQQRLEAMALDVTTLREDVSRELAEHRELSANRAVKPKSKGSVESWTKLFAEQTDSEDSQRTPEGFRSGYSGRKANVSGNNAFKHKPVTTRAQAQAQRPQVSELYEEDEETRRRLRDQYKMFESLKFDDNADLYIERLMGLVAYMYRVKPPNATLYNFLYAKCSKEVQEAVETSGEVSVGDYDALRDFLKAKVGRRGQASHEFAEMMRKKDKTSWKDLIRKIEQCVNDENFRDGTESNEVAKYKQYKEKIKQFCDDETYNKLREHGYLREGATNYEELCEFLYDQDERRAELNNRSLRHNVVEGSTKINNGDTQELSPYCTYCKAKTHFFSNCPMVFWFPRATPLPPGVNDTCNANTKCWSPSCKGTRVSHWTRHCPNFDYRFIEGPS